VTLCGSASVGFVPGHPCGVAQLPRQGSRLLLLCCAFLSRFSC